MIQEEKKVSSMEKLNKDLDIKVGAVYYMDESRIRGERIDRKILRTRLSPSFSSFT